MVELSNASRQSTTTFMGTSLILLFLLQMFLSVATKRNEGSETALIYYKFKCQLG